MKHNISLISLLFFLTTSISHADDYVWGEEFKEGDIISAETFNQIFNTLEKLNRTPKDSDLLGTWSCSSLHTSTGGGLDTTGWTLNDFVYSLNGAQLTMTASSQNTSLAQSFTYSTSNPSPFVRNFTNAASTGSYILYKGILLLKGALGGADNSVTTWQVNIVSDDQFTLSSMSTSANNSTYVVCDSAVAVPAAPTATTATNAQTLVNVTWTDNSTDEIGFKIYRRLSNETEATEIATAVTASPYVDSTLTEGQIAYYGVVAYNDNGESAKSKVVSATLDSIKPFVISTSPINGGNTNTRAVSITFSEQIKIICPSGIDSKFVCNDPPPIKLVGLGNTYYMGSVGYSGLTISNQNAFIDGANPSYTVTIDSDYINDLNGNKMSEDYVFTFSDN